MDTPKIIKILKIKQSTINVKKKVMKVKKSSPNIIIGLSKTPFRTFNDRAHKYNIKFRPCGEMHISIKTTFQISTNRVYISKYAGASRGAIILLLSIFKQHQQSFEIQ